MKKIILALTCATLICSCSLGDRQNSHGHASIVVISDVQKICSRAQGATLTSYRKGVDFEAGSITGNEASEVKFYVSTEPSADENTREDLFDEKALKVPGKFVYGERFSDGRSAYLVSSKDRNSPGKGGVDIRISFLSESRESRRLAESLVKGMEECGKQ